MDRSSNLSSAIAVATIAAPYASQIRLTRGPPASREQALAGDGAAVSADVTRSLSEDRDRIAQDLNDVVVNRLFAAGLDLEAALGLIGDQRVAGHIGRAAGALDQAIRDLRDTVFDRAHANGDHILR
ncbi:MAG: histidine kinase [Micromonosporaceae bacterium]